MYMTVFRQASPAPPVQFRQGARRPLRVCLAARKGHLRIGVRHTTRVTIILAMGLMTGTPPGLEYPDSAAAVLQRRLSSFGTPWRTADAMVQLRLLSIRIVPRCLRADGNWRRHVRQICVIETNTNQLFYMQRFSYVSKTSSLK